jgi:hypothetical protein
VVARAAAAVVTVTESHVIQNWRLKPHLRMDLSFHWSADQGQGSGWPTPAAVHSDQELDSI